jgi:hypothetical protein
VGGAAITSTTVSNWNTAYGWGNHATAGYLTSLPVHNHDDRYYTETEINSFLSGKVSTENFKVLGGGINYDLDRTLKVESGLAIYGAYSGGINSPFAYDIAAQFAFGSRGFELSADWINDDGANLKLRTLRDCCTNWSPWVDVITSYNIEQYALTSLPAHTHTIANVTGLQTALDGKLSTSGKAADSELLDGVDSSRFVYGESGNRRGTNIISNWNQTDFPDVAFLSAENGGTNAPTSDYTYGTQYSFHRSGAAYRTQLVTALYSDTSIYVRNSRDSDVWTSWKRLWHSGDFTSTNISNWNTAYGWGNHATAGYIVQGTQILSGAEWPTATRFGSVGDISQAAGNHALSVRSEVGNDAFMSFHIGNDYAVHFGLDDVTNRLHVGGWSETGNKYQIWDSRDFTSTNISNWNTAYGWGNHAGLYLPLSGGTMTGSITLKYSTADSSDYDGLRFAPYSDVAGLDDYIIKAASDKGVFGRKSFGWHVHTESAFGVYSNGWEKLFGVEGGTGNTQVFGSLTVNGSITESSSIRYKKDIVDIEHSSSKIELLRPVRYKKIKDESEEIGLIAEDVAELFPEVVKYDNEGRPDGVNYSRLSVILLKAVQELTERVNKLENK